MDLESLITVTFLVFYHHPNWNLLAPFEYYQMSFAMEDEMDGGWVVPSTTALSFFIIPIVNILVLPSICWVSIASCPCSPCPLKWILIYFRGWFQKDWSVVISKGDTHTITILNTSIRKCTSTISAIPAHCPFKKYDGWRRSKTLIGCWPVRWWVVVEF